MGRHKKARNRGRTGSIRWSCRWRWTGRLAHFEVTHPDQWHIDGRQLTRDELRAIHDMQPPDLIGYHLIQDQVMTGCSDHGRPTVRRTLGPA
jgi:hypothetical protein